MICLHSHRGSLWLWESNIRDWYSAVVSGDGMIDFEEFKHLMHMKMKATDGGGDIKELFTVLDIDKNGYFTSLELYKVILSFGENVSYQEAMELVESIPTKEPGKVNYDGRS